MCKTVFFDNYRIEWQRAGAMEAIVNNNQLIAHYNFISEGMHLVREVICLIRVKPRAGKYGEYELSER